MYNIEELTAETKKYLKKLKNMIEIEPTFFITKTKLIKKTRIDDVLCCIEASFPDAYKSYIKNRGGRSMKSYSCYLNLNTALKNKIFLFGDSYSINDKEAMTLIITMTKSIDNDLKLILNNETHMF